MHIDIAEKQGSSAHCPRLQKKAAPQGPRQHHTHSAPCAPGPAAKMLMTENLLSNCGSTRWASAGWKIEGEVNWRRAQEHECLQFADSDNNQSQHSSDCADSCSAHGDFVHDDFKDNDDATNLTMPSSLWQLCKQC